MFGHRFRIQYYMTQFRRNQWKPIRGLMNIQLQRLKMMIKYAYDYVPYYHRLFKSAKFRPEYIRDHDDIRKIPTTTKKDLQKSYPDTIAKGTVLSNQYSTFTSGSTGIPLKVIKGKRTVACHNAQGEYVIRECSVKRGDKLVQIRSVYESVKMLPIGNFLSRILNYMVPAYEESERIANVLKQINPDAILTYPSVLTDLSISDASGINPKVILSGGETLSQHCRDSVRRAFDLEINNFYATQELDCLAFECNEHAGLHMITDCALLEFLKEEEPVAGGEVGEIVVTGLYNHVMPFVRYRLGDLGIPSDEECSCGRRWPLIKSVEHKTRDFFVLPSGRRISPGAIHRNIYKEEGEQVFGISQWQLIQEKRDKVVLKVVKGRDFDANAIESIRKKIEAIFVRLGEKVEVDLQIVAKIPRGRTGKRCSIISYAE